MKKNYLKPLFEVTKLLTEDVLSVSGEEVFIPGGGLFEDLFN